MPLVADKVSASNSSLRRLGRKAMSMTSAQLIAIYLTISVVSGAIALFLTLRQGVGFQSTLSKPSPSEALARLTNRASAPIAKLAELGWTVTPQPDKLQFSNSGPKLPDMNASADLLGKLDRPFVLRLQGLASLEGLHLLSANTQCTEIGIGAGEFTETVELAGFQSLTKACHLPNPAKRQRDPGCCTVRQTREPPFSRAELVASEGRGICFIPDAIGNSQSWPNADYRYFFGSRFV
jgi:hypothetical protein